MTLMTYTKSNRRSLSKIKTMLTCRVDTDLFDILAHVAAHRKTTISALIRQYITKGLNEENVSRIKKI